MAFRDVVNQHHAVMLLRGAAVQGRPAHAYLFVGPAGVGRRSVAIAFAQFLNCERPTQDACGECRHCTRIGPSAAAEDRSSSRHPDVRVLDITRGELLVEPPRDYKAREIPIDQIRALKQDAAFPPYEGTWKVYVIADAELLSPGAANSLLKVLEEPPPNVVIILIAETTLPLPATITSRCQLVRFGLVPAADIARMLVERHGVPQDRATFLSALAAGRVARAVEWAARDDLLGARDRFLNVLQRMEQADPLERLAAAEEFARDRERLPDLLEIAGFWYRDLLVWKETADERLIVNVDQREAIRRLGTELSLDALRRRYEAVEGAKESLAMNVQQRLLLESFFFKILPVGAPV